MANWTFLNINDIIYDSNALISTDWKELVDVLSYMLLLRSDKDITDVEQLLGIRNQLDIFSDLFNNIFTEMRIDTGKAGLFRLFFANIKTVCFRAYYGSISIPQGIWIFFYTAYVIIIQTNYANIPFPIDAITTLWFFMGLCITSGHTTGRGSQPPVPSQSPTAFSQYRSSLGQSSLVVQSQQYVVPGVP